MNVMVNPGIVNNPKLWKLSRALQESPVQSLGHLVSLWCATMTHEPGGVLAGWTVEEIAHAAGWEKDAGEFVEILTKLQWLDKVGEDYAVHRWKERQSDPLKRREQWWASQKKTRAIQKQSEGRENNGKFTGLLAAFRFCHSPGDAAKIDAFRDMERQGVSEERLLAAANDPMNRNQDFWQIIRNLRPAKPSVESPF